MKHNQISHLVCVFFLIIGLWLALPAAADKAVPMAAEFSLLDQYGKSYCISYPQEKVCVFVFADKWGCTQVEGWVRPIYERYKDTIMILGVAQLANVPSWLQPTLLGIFKRSIKYSVMMDWTGDVSRKYGYPGVKAFVVIVDREGVIQTRVKGKASTDLIEKCCNIINELRLGDSVTAQPENRSVKQTQ
jgi:hypothetical protein